MCDTIAIVRPGRVLFAKNSDRDPNEAQVLEWHPAAEHARGATLRCTWIEIPQAERTHAVMISRPFWMWGAEMGSNEHGVTIGNEAVFTNQPYAKMGLTGMDLLRLALERADTAAGAVELIIALIHQHGQGGGCGHEHRGFTYHNSFIVADPREAFVLETAGRHTAVEQIDGVRSISNGLTIPAFREKFASRVHEVVSACAIRRARTEELAGRHESAEGLICALQDYGGEDAPSYTILNGGLGVPCVHAGGILVNTQTTASMVSELRSDYQVHWVTATSIPSISLFKAVGVNEPVEGAAPTDKADSESLWWKHERLCRRVFRNPAQWLPEIQRERDDIQRRWLADPPEPTAAFEAHHRFLDAWLARVPQTPRDMRPWYTRRYWAKRDALAGLP